MATGRMKVIGVVGAGDCDEHTGLIAQQVGRLIADRGAALVCGGMGGVMQHAAMGAAQMGGLTIGILPGDGREDANPYINLPIVTDMGHGRNVIIAHTAQALIAISGEYGTLSEIAIALKLNKPVICLGGWTQIKNVINVSTPQEAVDAVFEYVV